MTVEKDSLPRLERGLVQVYTGDGKGKTTAALGLALRAAGWGYRTFIGQFMKGQDYGELHSIPRLAPYITIEQFGEPHFIHLNEASPEDIERAQRGLQRIREVLKSQEYAIVILDEICIALYFQLVSIQDVLQLIEERPPKIELVLTGRRAPKEILEKADLVTEMAEIKHPYQQGIAARRGIEF
ncbi:MAG: cob(I)yrinic acid a,c-diamide adenosyltransferase [Anaerolineae bacterium]|nr:cob(I)yrinic acid a,c-diamide adenosyltransferase [Anaerolineae bacterium]